MSKLRVKEKKRGWIVQYRLMFMWFDLKTLVHIRVHRSYIAKYIKVFYASENIAEEHLEKERDNNNYVLNYSVGL